MSEEIRLKQLGLNEKEIKQDVNVMGKEIIIERIEQLELMPIDKFNKLLLQPEGTIIDKKIVIIQKSKCNKIKKCENILIQFDILFNYIIGGFKTNEHIYTIEDISNSRERIIDSRNWLNSKTLKRKGGLFHLKVNYNHHTTFCGNSYIGSTIRRTIWSLLIPNYSLLIDNGFNVNDILETFEQINDARDTCEPSLDGIEELHKEFQIEGCTLDHSDDFCTEFHNDENDENYECDNQHFINAEEYYK